MRNRQGIREIGRTMGMCEYRKGMCRERGIGNGSDRAEKHWQEGTTSERKWKECCKSMNYARNRQVVREMGRTIGIREHRKKMFWERRIVKNGDGGGALAKRRATSDSARTRSVGASVVRDSALGDAK